MKSTTIQLVKINNLENKIYVTANGYANGTIINDGQAKSLETKSLVITNNLAIKGVSYEIKDTSGVICKCRSKQKQILKDINILVKVGKVAALLGNSGSGKTSLLDVLAHNHQGKVKGKAYLGDIILDRKVFKRKCGYVVQSDSLTSMPNLTTYDTLHYIAQLKFKDSSMTKEEIAQKVQKVMSEMKIWHVRDVIVGGKITRGISGGEKRRTCIAAQLLQDPDVLLLDEPTTGLDSFTAHEIIKSVSELAKQNSKVVLLSIHQPRSDIFQLLDYIGILSAGQMVYYGKRSEMIPYFASIGYRCPTYSNPLDYAVDIASIDRRSVKTENETKHHVNLLQEKYKTSQLYNEMLQDIQQSIQKCSDIQHTEKTHNKARQHRYMVSQEITAIVILLRHMCWNISRDRASFVVRGSTMTAYAAFIWIFCMQIGFDYSTIQDRSGIFYMTTSVPPMVGVLNAVALFPSLRDQYIQESTDGLYNALAFLTAYVIHIIPFNIVSSFLFSLWAYYGVGLHPGFERFLIFFSMISVGQHLGEMLAVFILGIFKKPLLAESVATLVVNVGVLLSSGLVGATSSLLVPLQWLSYAHFIKFSSEIVVSNEYYGLKFECEMNGTVSECRGFDGDSYLDLMFPDAVENLGRNYGILAGFILFFFVSDILLLKWLKRRRW